MTYAIEATALTKRFGKTQALAGVDLAVRDPNDSSGEPIDKLVSDH